MRGQGAFEYLLIIGGSVLLASITLMFVQGNLNTISPNINATRLTAAVGLSCSDCDAVFVNEGQPKSITRSMLADDVNFTYTSIYNSTWNVSGNNQYSTVTGNVGIGQSSPSYNLDVGGNVHATGNMTLDSSGWLNSSSGFADSGIDFGYGSKITRRALDGRIQYTSQSGVHEFVGSVGIGTASPSGKLGIQGTGGSWSSYNFDNTLTIDANGITHTAIGVKSGTTYYAIGFGYSGSEVDFMRMPAFGNTTAAPKFDLVISNGNVGVGTTTPAVPLDVSGYLHVSGNASPVTTSQGAYLDWNALNGGTGETDFINNQGGGTGGFAFMNTNSTGTPRNTLVVINGSGYVGVGTTSPAAKLEVNGKILMDSATVSTDSATTVATKGYVDSKVSSYSASACVTVSVTNPNPSGNCACVATCPAGYYVTGGGGSTGTLTASYPTNNSAWFISGYCPVIICYARCCP